MRLMTDAGDVAPDSPVTRVGGVPLANPDFSWPVCASCAGPMQFVSQIRLDDLPDGGREQTLLVFMCQNDPGLCDEWDAKSGGNFAALLDNAGLVASTPPASGETSVDGISGVEFVTSGADGADDGTAYFEAGEQWAEANGRSPRDFLGQIGGEPAWLQGDQTPSCAGCHAPMSFVAQLEEGQNNLNFGGGGVGYAFACQPCHKAAFLTQC